MSTFEHMPLSSNPSMDPWHCQSTAKVLSLALKVLEELVPVVFTFSLILLSQYN